DRVLVAFDTRIESFLVPVYHLWHDTYSRAFSRKETSVSMDILTEDMKRMMTQQRLGYAATVCPDGTPNVSPPSSIVVWDESRVMFADIRSPNTVSNLRDNPAIEINVVDPIVRKGYRFKGTATVYTEGAFFEQAVAFYRERGSGLPVRSIVLVK